MLFANSAEITQCNQKAQDHPRGKTVFPGPYSLYGLSRTTHTKVKEQVKKKVILFWQEKETHGKEPVHCKSEGDDNLQIQTQIDR